MAVTELAEDNETSERAKMCTKCNRGSEGPELLDLTK